MQVDGHFAWETVLATWDGVKGKHLHGNKGKKHLKKETLLPTTTADLEKEILKDVEKNEQETPFELKNLKLSIPKGAFVGIVGRVGSGKVWFWIKFWEFELDLLTIPLPIRAPYCKHLLEKCAGQEGM